MEYFQTIQSYKKETNVTTRCRIPKFCERHKVDIDIYDLKSKRVLPRSVKQRDKCLYIQKNHNCIFWKASRRNVLPNGVEEIEKKIQIG